jgi:hypothetical protein
MLMDGLKKYRCAVLALFAAMAVQTAVNADDPLPCWNGGPAKKAIIDFVQVTTSKGSDKFVKPGERIATFDEDGTTWVEHPMYTEVVFSLDRLAELRPNIRSGKTLRRLKLS